MIIINIGDELLLGQVVNTNAAFICQKLALENIAVSDCFTIPDEKESIKNTIDLGFSKSDCVIITGGLGPTKDDITKVAICDYFNCGLKIDEDTLEWVAELFRARNKELTETNRKQAEVPECCEVIKNSLGTAPGIWIEQGGKILVAMPGVPFEMEKMLCDDIIPKLKTSLNIGNTIHYKVLQCTNVAESDLSDKLEDFEKSLPENIKLAYLPKPGVIRLRLTMIKGNGYDESLLDNYFEKLKTEVGNLAFANKDVQLEEIIGELLRGSDRRVATAESCTGGFIAHLITSVPGSSEYYQGGVVAYNNDIKRNILNVREDNLKKHGAVSEMVVSDMALNVMELFDTNYAVATSGVAGPGGGTDEKPVGTVWIAVATPTRLTTKLFNFGKFTGRKQIIERASNAALNMLRIEIERDFKK